MYLYHVELPVTLKCSLKCAKCGFLMPYFHDPVDYQVEDLLKYMDKLFECVDAIQIFRILGGEPCGNICRYFHNGRLYFCPRASFGTKLSIPDNEGDFVDFTEDTNREELREKIYRLNQKKYLVACNYCDEGTSKAISVPVAEQLAN